MKLEEVIIILKAAQEAHKDASFECDNHWFVNYYEKDNKFTFEYICCESGDDCGDWSNYGSNLDELVEEQYLKENHPDGWRWI